MSILYVKNNTNKDLVFSKDSKPFTIAVDKISYVSSREVSQSFLVSELGSDITFLEEGVDTFDLPVVSAFSESFENKRIIRDAVQEAVSDLLSELNVSLSTIKDSVEAIQESEYKYITYVDDVSENIRYFGYAVPGSLESAAVWRVEKAITTGNVTALLKADGNANYDNIWDNRASLTYA